MKSLSVILNVVLVLAVLGWIGISNLFTAMERGVCKRHGADLISIAHALQSYHHDHRAYPPAMGIEDIRPILEPHYIKLMPVYGVRYFSDGLHYELWFHDPRPGGLGRCFACALQIRDGTWSSFPSGVALPAVAETTSTAS
jgi:hypothetical protein